MSLEGTPALANRGVDYADEVLRVVRREGLQCLVTVLSYILEPHPPLVPIRELDGSPVVRNTVQVGKWILQSRLQRGTHTLLDESLDCTRDDTLRFFRVARHVRSRYRQHRIRKSHVNGVTCQPELYGTVGRSNRHTVARCRSSSC